MSYTKVMQKKISFQDFKQLELRVARVVEVNPLGGSKKLYLITLNLGRERRQVVAGLKPYYSIDELMNKEVVLVVNLEEKEIYGHLSQGMLLAADDGQGKVSLLVPDKPVKEGSEVR